MKSNGSKYVAVVIAVLVGYFAYQSWFNPRRAVARRLSNLAAALSIPAEDSELNRVARAAQVRTWLAEPVRVRVGRERELTSRDAVVGAIAGWTPPPGGATVAFVDVQIELIDDATARAFATVEISTRNAQTGETTVDSRDCVIRMARQDGEWMVSEAEVKEPPPQP